MDDDQLFDLLTEIEETVAPSDKPARFESLAAELGEASLAEHRC